MNYWMWNEINGVSVVFTDDHVGVSTTCDLDDPETIAALKIAQQLSPAIKTHYDLTNHAWDYETNSINWGRIPFDVMQDFVIAVTDIPEFFRSYLSSEVLSAYFLATSPELLRAEISKAAAKKAVKPTPKPKPGYVYLLKGPSGYYKIGMTQNPATRRASFGVTLPFEVEFECLIKTDDMSGLELKLHDMYSNRRVNGEWFNLTSEDIAYIKSLGGVA